MMRRIGIFLFYDGNGKVSPHVHTSIKAFAKYCDEFIFVANGSLDMKSFSGLENIVTHVLRRENTGFDVWGYKEGLEYVGYENLKNYDEIIFLNYTFFAPTADIGTMFDRMAGRSGIDAWGITEYSDSGKSFLQSYFLCTRNSLHCTQDYKSYWQSMPMINSIDDSLKYHEFRFSRHFRSLGYILESYVNNRNSWNGNTTLTDVKGLLDEGAPVIKYRSFNFDPDIIEARGGSKVARNFQIAQDSTRYPIDEIWNYIIDQTPPDSLISSAELCQVVSGKSDAGALTNVTAIATLEDIKTVDLAFDRLNRLPSNRVVISTDNEDIRNAARGRGYKLQKVDTLRIGLRYGRKHLANAAELGEGVIHVSDFAQERDRYFFKEMLFENYWDPLFCSDAINWLSRSEHLGLIFAIPDAVAGIESFRFGTGTSFGNWKQEFRPEYLRRAACQFYWPWRGNFMIKSQIGCSEKFQRAIFNMINNIVIRERESVAGPEAALPELIRSLGYASGVVVPKSEVAKFLLRSSHRAKVNSRSVAELTKKFRSDVRLSQRPSVPNNLSPVALSATGDDKNTTHSHDGIKLKKHMEGKGVCYFINKNGQEERYPFILEPRYFFERKVVSDDSINTIGWAFDSKNPHDYINIGVLKGDEFIFGPDRLQESRPDVLDAFSDLPLVEYCGFNISLKCRDLKSPSDCKIVLLNPERKSICFVPLSDHKNSNSVKGFIKNIFHRYR